MSILEMSSTIFEELFLDIFLFYNIFMNKISISQKSRPKFKFL